MEEFDGVGTTESVGETVGGMEMVGGIDRVGVTLEFPLGAGVGVEDVTF